MKVIAIIQARMSSRRLPGKVLMNLAGKPVLQHVIERLNYCKTFKEIIVATSIDKSDDEIENFCQENKINIFRGSLNDVLDRFYQAGKLYGADAILRITADCPVIDPEVVDVVVKNFKKNNSDLCGLSGSFPDGLDCSVFAFSAIEKAWSEAKLKSEREHVGPYIEKHPNIFRILPIEIFQDLGDHRWTLDEQRDYDFLIEVYDELYMENKIFYTRDILNLLSKKPHLSRINAKIIRNEGYLNSLDQD